MRGERGTPEVLALIPARGGSESIPRKNLLSLAGSPLIAYSIAQALESRHITRTIVSTDDPEIAAVARACGADVPFLRPSELAGNRSLDLETFRHALGWLREHEGYTCEAVVHLRPTGPMRRVQIIDAAIAELLSRPEADSLRSVSMSTQTPFKMWRMAGEYLEPLLQIDGVVEPYCQPRQSLPDVYWQNGYVDIVRPRVVLEDGLMCGHRVLPFVIDEPVLELDYPESIPVLEAALVRLREGRWPPVSPAEKRHPV